ncbi:MAG: hypothetical protein HOJ15_04405 [Candidatus Jacksonbacteria bacterium]|jgi:hypothetical protein|nr:hypothetical protein [Candidatus Jacksonbacteria bacterium]MBT6034805.1 hypothetical protein [Candidatus Jacksonbacteria bacterium]MBT6301641.1 hypothetical protein [Candidatus Jacksonbacteria bacterium]MBT6757470.1 hypothetical protein [Candidatus Jacksonbacteria bacterium]MBT6955220.1 hypothetical protein [Candidatus Jacksonbacteria bacterium]
MATRTGHLIGIQSESVVAAALKQMKGECNCPVTSFRRRDCEAYDYVVEIGTETIYLEVKTSWNEAYDHLRQFPNVVVIIVRHHSVLLTGRKRRRRIRSAKSWIRDALAGFSLKLPQEHWV